MANQTNIYDNQIYFGITYEGRTVLILEPDKWNKISNHIFRDPNYFGFWSDFLEDKYGMMFTFIKGRNITGGGEILQEIYNTVGAEAEVLFEIGYKKFSTLQRVNQWRINLNDYNADFGGVKTSIEKMPFQSKLKSRFSSPCTINQYSTIDGALLTPISSWQMRLHSKTILETSECLSQNPLSPPELPASYFDTYLIVQPDQSNLIINELSTVYSQSSGILDTTSRDPASGGTPAAANGSGLDKLPFSDQISQYAPSTSGVLTVTWEGGSSDCAFYYYSTGGDNNYWRITPRLVVQRLISGVWTIVEEVDGTSKIISVHSDTGINPTSPMTGIDNFDGNPVDKHYILPSVTGAGPRGDIRQVKGYTFSEVFSNISVQANDSIYVQLLMCPNGTVKSPTDKWIQIDQFVNKITYTQLTVTPSTTANGYRAFDIINQMIENITGFKDRIISTFFSKGGEGYDFLFTNGYSIRNYGDNIYQPVKDLQSFLNSLQARFCLSIGIKTINGDEYLEIEYLPDFFKYRTIATFKNTFEWKDIHSSKYSFNKVEIGYTKYEGLNIIQQDEFCTQGKYTLQALKTQDNSLNKMCDIIFAGYLIEEQRRYQFLLNPGKSLTNDNDWFGISIASPLVFHQQMNGSDGLPYIVCRFGASESVFGANITSIGLKAGDTIRSFSGINSGTTFTIVSEYPGFPIIGQDLYYVTPAPLDEIGVISGFIVTPASPNQVFAERNNPFKICSGVIDPSTIYNGRSSLKHILYAWRPLLGIGLDKINPLDQDYRVSQIVTNLVRMNSLLTLQFLETEEFKGNIGDLKTVEIAREFISNYLSIGSNLFSSTGAECKLRIGWNDMDLIRKALCGELGDNTKDHGGLVLNDDYGVLWFCQVMDIQYNFVTEICTLQVQKVKTVANVE